MIEAVRRYEGYVVQSTGDGIFALFGARSPMRSSAAGAVCRAQAAGRAETLFGPHAPGRQIAAAGTGRSE